MENNTNLTLNAILNLKYILGIKNDYVLAEKLDIARNTISGIKKRNSSGALFEKVCELKKNSLSFDAIFKAKNEDEIKYFLIVSNILKLVSKDVKKLKQLNENLKEVEEALRQELILEKQKEIDLLEAQGEDICILKNLERN